MRARRGCWTAFLTVGFDLFDTKVLGEWNTSAMNIHRMEWIAFIYTHKRLGSKAWGSRLQQTCDYNFLHQSQPWMLCEHPCTNISSRSQIKSPRGKDSLSQYLSDRLHFVLAHYWLLKDAFYLPPFCSQTSWSITQHVPHRLIWKLSV